MDLYINNTETDAAYGASGVDWIKFESSTDGFIFSEGSTEVADGESIPTTEELNRAAVQLDDENAVTVDKYFLMDVSEDEIREIFNAGNQNKRYVFCAVFDSLTASEPQLEAWDDSDMNSYDDVSLGSGTPSASWYRGICTTDGVPGVSWTGTPLAGSGEDNVLKLNNGNGALTEAKNLYFNFKVVIPGGYVTPGQHNPILAITYTVN